MPIANDSDVQRAIPERKGAGTVHSGHPVLGNSTMLFDEDVAQQGGTRQRFFFNAVEGEMLDMQMVKVDMQ